MKDKNKCKICGGPAGEKFVIREMLHGTRELFDYFQCTDCGCIQIVEVPDNISDYYPNDYYSYSNKKKKKNLPIKTFFRKARSRYALEGKGIFGAILHHFKGEHPILSMYADLGTKLSDRILDVGGGTGEHSWQLKCLGFEHTLCVDKFIESNIVVGNTLVAKKGDIMSVEGEFDLITLHHSFEHMDEQHDILRKARQLLKKDGRVLVRIPSVSCEAWDIYGVNWAALDAPRHFFIHSHKSIRLLAEQVGLRVVRLWCDSDILQFWASEQYSKDISMYAENSYDQDPAKSIFCDGQIAEFQRRTIELNEQGRGDSICVLLEPEAG